MSDLGSNLKSSRRSKRINERTRQRAMGRSVPLLEHFEEDIAKDYFVTY